MSVPKTINPNGQELELLPTTADELDAFVASITAEYGLPAGDGTYETIATAILHMPSSHAYAPRAVFGHSGLKQMANTVAYAKLEEFGRKRKAAAEALKTPTDSEAVKSADAQPV